MSARYRELLVLMTNGACDNLGYANETNFGVMITVRSGPLSGIGINTTSLIAQYRPPPSPPPCCLAIIALR